MHLEGNRRWVLLEFQDSPFLYTPCPQAQHLCTCQRLTCSLRVIHMVFSFLVRPNQSGSMGWEGDNGRINQTTSFAYLLSVPCSSVKKHCKVILQPGAKMLRKCTLFGLKWRVYDLLFVLPPPFVKVASDTRPCLKLAGTTWNGGEGRCEYYISQMYDQQHFEVKMAGFDIFASVCSIESDLQYFTTKSLR